MIELLRFSTEHAHKLVEAWPELLGGFVAFWMHTIHHRLFHAIHHLPRSAVKLMTRRMKGGHA